MFVVYVCCLFSSWAFRHGSGVTTKVRDVDAVSKMLQAGFGADRCHGLCVAHNAGCGEKRKHCFRFLGGVGRWMMDLVVQAVAVLFLFAPTWLPLLWMSRTASTTLDPFLTPHYNILNLVAKVF